MISFIYFDLGGVVIKDFSGNNKWTEMKNDLGIKKEDSERFTAFFDQLEEELNIGRDVETVVPLIEKEFNIKFPENYSMLNDFVKKFEKNESIWPIIEIAQKQGKVGLLTNMYPNMFEAIKNNNLLPSTNWDAIVDSSIVGVKKPNKEIYEIAEKKSGVSKDKILFIDNSLENVNAAKKLGWQTFHYNSINPKESNIKLSNFLTEEMHSVE